MNDLKPVLLHIKQKGILTLISVLINFVDVKLQDDFYCYWKIFIKKS